MAKKGKTTLKDLNKFLHQEPNKLAEVDKISISKETGMSELSFSSIIDQVNALANKNGESVSATLMKLAQNALEEQSDLSAKELMLLNTLIYLQKD